MTGPGSPLLGWGTALLGWGTALLGITTAGLALRAGGRLFRMLLVVMFGVLAIQAIRNINLFGLVAGYVLACNLGEWAAAPEPASRGETKPRWLSTGSRAGLVVTIALCGLVGLLLWSIVSNRFFRLTGERRHFGAFASPLAYAHEAARFAGQPGLPDRAVAFGLRQAGVYMFHNGPGASSSSTDRTRCTAVRRSRPTSCCIACSARELRGGPSRCAGWAIRSSFSSTRDTSVPRLRSCWIPAGAASITTRSPRSSSRADVGTSRHPFRPSTSRRGTSTSLRRFRRDKLVLCRGGSVRPRASTIWRRLSDLGPARRVLSGSRSCS